MRVSVVLFALFLLSALTASALAQGPEHLAPNLAWQREFVEDARRFLQSARTGLDRFAGLPEGLLKTAYLSGLKDGALAAAVVLVVLYLVFLQPKKP